jgi:hypothetical protein
MRLVGHINPVLYQTDSSSSIAAVVLVMSVMAAIYLNRCVADAESEAAR